MAWGLVAQVGLNLVQGSIASKQAAQQSIASNKATQAYNKQVITSSLEQINQINMQRAVQRQQSTAALYNISQQGLSARDQITTQAAATDTIGASVNDAVATVNQKQDQAVGSVYEQYRQAVEQTNLMVNKVTDSGIRGLKDATKDTSQQVMDSAILNSVGNIAGYFAGKAASGTNSAAKPTGNAGTALDGGYDIHGFSADKSVSKDPFGLTFDFQASNLLK